MINLSPLSVCRRAFTLLELMLVLALVAVLMLLAYQGYGVYAKKGESVACTKNMVNMGVALANYVSDKQEWPQESVLNDPNGKPPEEDALWNWWYEQMKEYGMGREDWYCPADLRTKKKEQAADKESGKEEGGTGALKDPTYIPGQFGPGQYAPYNNPNQPWAIERWAHPEGMNKLMPNGTVQKEFNFKALKDMRGGAAPAN